LIESFKTTKTNFFLSHVITIFNPRLVLTFLDHLSFDFLNVQSWCMINFILSINLICCTNQKVALFNLTLFSDQSNVASGRDSKLPSRSFERDESRRRILPRDPAQRAALEPKLILQPGLPDRRTF